MDLDWSSTAWMMTMMTWPTIWFCLFKRTKSCRNSRKLFWLWDSFMQIVSILSILKIIYLVVVDTGKSSAWNENAWTMKWIIFLYKWIISLHLVFLFKYSAQKKSELFSKSKWQLSENPRWLRLDGCAGGGRYGGPQPDLPAAAAGAGRGLRPVCAIRQVLYCTVLYCTVLFVQGQVVWPGDGLVARQVRDNLQHGAALHLVIIQCPEVASWIYAGFKYEAFWLRDITNSGGVGPCWLSAVNYWLGSRGK